MSDALGAAMQARMKEIDQELATLDSQAAPLRAEHKTLERSLRDIEAARSGTAQNGAQPAVVDNESIKATVAQLAAEGVEKITSKEVGERLGVGARNVARKLRKLVDDGVLVGDPSSGYSPAVE